MKKDSCEESENNECRIVEVTLGRGYIMGLLAFSIFVIIYWLIVIFGIVLLI